MYYILKDRNNESINWLDISEEVDNEEKLPF